LSEVRDKGQHQSGARSKITAKACTLKSDNDLWKPAFVKVGAFAGPEVAAGSRYSPTAGSDMEVVVRQNPYPVEIAYNII